MVVNCILVIVKTCYPNPPPTVYLCSASKGYPVLHTSVHIKGEFVQHISSVLLIVHLQVMLCDNAFTRSSNTYKRIGGIRPENSCN